MLRMLRSLAVLCILLAPALASASQARSADEIYREIKAEEDKCDKALFETLGRMQSPEALRALKRSIGFLRQPKVLVAAYTAFELFVEDVELREGALAFLEREALKGKRDANRAGAIAGLGACGKPAAEALRRIVERARSTEERQLACAHILEDLGQAGDLESLRLLIDYGQPDGSSTTRKGRRDKPSSPRAMLVLALRNNLRPEVIELCLQRLRDRETSGPWKLVLIDVLAETQGPQVRAALVESVGCPDSAVMRRAVGALIGRAELEGLEGNLRAMLNHDSPTVRRVAVEALGHLLVTKSTWPKELERLSVDKDEATRLGATVALMTLRTPRAQERLQGMLGDGAWAVRLEALWRLASLRNVKTVGVLIEELPTARGRYGDDVARALRLLTGEDHGRNADRWRAWWADHQEHFELPTLETCRAKEQRRQKQDVAKGGTTTAFYGLEVVSDRICFVLDKSGSMERAAGGRRKRGTTGGRVGRTRMDIALEELRGVIERYPAGDLFQLVFFSDNARAWCKEVQTMGEEVREDALEYMEDQRSGGGTALFDGLALALENPLIDTVYLLSDGDPTAGALVDPDQILEEIRLRSETRRVQIHCVALGQESPLLRRMAAATGGDYRYVP